MAPPSNSDHQDDYDICWKSLLQTLTFHCYWEEPTPSNVWRFTAWVPCKTDGSPQSSGEMECNHVDVCFPSLHLPSFDLLVLNLLGTWVWLRSLDFQTECNGYIALKKHDLLDWCPFRQTVTPYPKCLSPLMTMLRLGTVLLPAPHLARLGGCIVPGWSNISAQWTPNHMPLSWTIMSCFKTIE